MLYIKRSRLKSLLDRWVDGWMGRRESRVKDCLQQWKNGVRSWMPALWTVFNSHDRFVTHLINTENHNIAPICIWISAKWLVIYPQNSSNSSCDWFDWVGQGWRIWDAVDPCYGIHKLLKLNKTNFEVSIRWDNHKLCLLLSLRCARA
jgi:hypothetical protein